jgi:CHAT domain-containing protein/tetratricopeptide (TPR) repeat protein
VTVVLLVVPTFALLSGDAPATAGSEVLTGVVVQQVVPGSAGDRAGLRPGDVLLAWTRGASPPANPNPAEGSFQSPFDVDEAEIEQAPRGKVSLEGQRGGRAQMWELPPRPWGVITRPRIPGELGKVLERAAEDLAGHKPVEAAAGYRQATHEGGTLPPSIQAWVRYKALTTSLAANSSPPSASTVNDILSLLMSDGRAGMAAKLAVDLAMVLSATGREAEIATLVQPPLLRRPLEGPTKSLIMATLLEQSAEVAALGKQLDAAVQIANAALTLREQLAPGSIVVAQSLRELSMLSILQGDCRAATEYITRALTIREDLVPGSQDLALNLTALAREALARGDSLLAERYVLHAVAVIDQVPPESLLLAATLDSLGDNLRGRGDLAAAEDLYQRSLAMGEKLAPSSLPVTASLNNLGKIAASRGNLAAAEGLHRRALAIREKLAPNSLDVAVILNDLGSIAESRGDVTGAEALHRRALTIREKLAPGSLDLATSLSNLANIAQGRGDLATAEGLYRRALAIREKLAPGSMDVAASVGNLGNIARSRGDLAVAEDLYRRALAIYEERAPDSLDVAASLNNLGVVAESRGVLAAAEEFHRRALAIREKLAPGSLDLAMSLGNLGNTARSRGDLAAAEDLYRRALAIFEGQAANSIDVAAMLNNIGLVAQSRGDLAVAEDLQRRALAIKEKLAPGSLGVAASLNNLGNIAHGRGDLAAAEEFHRRALAIEEKLAPGSMDVAASVGNLGNIVRDRGDLAMAEDLNRRALAIYEERAPDSLEVATSLNNLGVLAQSRGDLAGAEDFQRRSLALKEKLAPGSLAVATSLNNLGEIADSRGDLAMAEDLNRRALAIREKLAPGSLDVAASLNNLGSIADSRGDLVAAEGFHRRALAIKEKLAPGSLAVAASLNNLGSIADSRGDLAAAEGFHRRALAIKEKLAPASLEIALSLNNLGLVVQTRGDLAAAEDLYRRALAINEKLAPGSLDFARVLNNLGRVVARQGKMEEARTLLCRAVDELDLQVGKLGGTQDARSEFSANWQFIYRECEAAQLALGERERAFHILERSRARSLLTMLAERDLLFTEVPAELARERRRVNAEYQRVQEVLGRLSAQEEREKGDELLGRLRELLQTQGQIVEAIRKASPGFAALQYPQPLDLPRVRSTLDPGTVLLSYSVGQDKTTLYVVQPPRSAESRENGRERNGDVSGLTILVLPVGEVAVRAKVAEFRQTVSSGRGSGRGVVMADDHTSGAEALGRELYDLLIRPAETLIGASDRLLISPDGPLHTLPFAALVRFDGKSSQYLFEWKPIHTVVSGTVYAELKRTRHPKASSSAARLVAFGDPHYPAIAKDQAEHLANPEVRAVVRSGALLQPLPFTREEVQAIAGFFPSSSRIYLGEEATEERAKAIGKDTQIVHFACHGLIDERFPLNSALALTIPESPKEGEDNGLLQAWEIFEKVRLDADLVTLSACETALGKEMGGEGLVGLTRAFQYAGARTVLASLWSVGDASTSELMKGFYRALKVGTTKDEALREAQLALLKNPRTAHPFHWAAFQIIGDWK